MKIEIGYEQKNSKFIREIGSFETVYQKIMDSSNYLTPIDEFHICRYCNETSQIKFRSKAHFIPEFAGNKNQFNSNECDECNNRFSLYENSLKNFGVLNIMLPIKGKKKFPIHRDNQNKTSTRFTDDKTIVTSISKEDAVYLDGNTIKVKRASNSFVPIYIQKALTKLAISMMPKEDLFCFKVLISWLLDKTSFTDENIEMMAFYTTDVKTKNLKPEAHLYKRIKRYNCPQYTLLFFWGYYKIQIFIPCNPHDIFLENMLNVKLPISKELDFTEENTSLLQFVDLNLNEKTIVSTASHHHFVNDEDLNSFKQKTTKNKLI